MAANYEELFDQQGEHVDEQILEADQINEKSAIERLPDLCLEKIFNLACGRGRLDWNDWDACDIAETCTRFYQVMQGIYPKTHWLGFVKVSSMRDTQYMDESMDDDWDAVCERKFRLFGNIFETIGLVLNGVSASDGVMNSIRKYCVDNWKTLRFSVQIFYFESLDPNLTQIVNKIETLELAAVTLQRDTFEYNDFVSLKTIRLLTQVPNCNFLLDNTFSILEEFICFLDDCSYCDCIGRFLSRHPRLTDLQINFPSRSRCNVNFTVPIGNNCLELRKLLLSYATIEDFAFVGELQHLRELELYGCKLPSDPIQLSYLTGLRKLTLTFGRRPRFSVLQIIRTLTHLEELDISHTVNYRGVRVRLSVETFTTILDVVRDRPKVLTLMCENDIPYALRHSSPNVKFVF